MPTDLAPRPLPLLTPELPGTGGVLRVVESDFRVEEVPLYLASGEGDHLLVTVEKTGRTTQEVARELAVSLGVNPREAGWAGLKDKRAIAAQRLSLPLPRGTAGPAALDKAEEFRRRALAASGPGWRAIEAARHGNKLRPGHLAGNRFRIVLRGCVPEARARAQAVLARLAQTGLANLFGPQRFGRRMDNAALGAAILARAPQAAAALRDRFLRKMALSALQSELFNRGLAARIADGLFVRAIEGDVLRKRERGGLFVCADPAADTARVVAGEIDPLGPLPGRSLFAAQGEALAREQAVLDEAGIDPRSFAVGGGEMEGTRRPYRIPLVEPLLELAPESGDPTALALTFTLPPGSYALCLLREVMKVGQEQPEEVEAHAE